jgi:C-terminal processing protease CtpA/Prc
MGSVKEWKIKDYMTWRGQNLHAYCITPDIKWKYTIQYTIHDKGKGYDGGAHNHD